MHKISREKFSSTSACKSLQTGVTQGRGKRGRISVLAVAFDEIRPSISSNPSVPPASRSRSHAYALILLSSWSNMTRWRNVLAPRVRDTLEYARFPFFQGSISPASYVKNRASPRLWNSVRVWRKKRREN